MNPAKSLALRLDGHTPLLWGTDAAAAAVAAHGAAALAAARRAWWRTPTTSAARPQAAGLRRALDLAARGRDIFHDPFADELGRPAAAPPRLVLLATDDEEPGQVTLRRTGRGWPSTDLLHPVEEVPRGTPPRRRCCAPRCWPPGSTWPRSTWGWPPARSNPPDATTLRRRLATPPPRHETGKTSWSCWTTPCAPTRGGRAP